MGGLWLTRLLLQRGLALVFLLAFFNAWFEFRALLGERGLLPVPRFVRRFRFRDRPSLFFFWPRDRAFRLAAAAGIVLSIVTLAGVTEALPTAAYMAIWALLWLLYLSFVNVGQTFYAFGWESILLEAGFYAIFLGPRAMAPPALVVWMFRWLIFRIMFGAGLIKLRGDPCWRDLTCLDDHYETQPMPNPLSWHFHHGPRWTRRAGVLVNHVAELAVPFGFFFPQPVASGAAILTVIFQLLIGISGNLSWLNLLTLVLALSGFAIEAPAPWVLHAPAPALRLAIYAVAALVAVLSVQPVINLLSPRQAMNTANRFHLVGSYGAFGAITRPRYEVVIEGTLAAAPGAADWHEYEFKGKPGDVRRRPPQVAPYHLRLDWLMWFAALSRVERQPWFLVLLGKLLEADPAVLALLRSDPFHGERPRLVRARRYVYRFTTPQERMRTGAWWFRVAAGDYFPPVGLQSAIIRAMLEVE